MNRSATAHKQQSASPPPRRARPWRGPLVADLALAVRAEPFSAAGWLFELKYDGFRMVAAKDAHGVTLRYRSGRVVTSVFPELEDAIAKLPTQRVLLDGELVAFGQDGRPDFELLRSRALRTRGTPSTVDVRFCVFDLLALDGDDLRPLPLFERKQALRELVTGADHRIVYVDDVERRGEELLAGARALRLEGIVAKRVDSAYVAGRSGHWRKVKVEDTADFIVIGIAAPSENTFGRPALVLAVVAESGLRYVGRVAVGGAELEVLAKVVAELRRPTPPCSGAGHAETWLEPTVVCEVRFLASSQRGLRHAVFVRFRPDKAWTECTG